MTHEVALATVEPRPTAVRAETTTWPRFRTDWRRMLAAVHAGVHWTGPGPKGRNLMLYRDGPGPDEVSVEVGVELDQPARVDDGLLRSSLPGGRVATTVHRGPYDGLAEAHNDVIHWCRARGITLAGPRWEIYGHWSEDPALLETEICYLIG